MIVEQEVSKLVEGSYVIEVVEPKEGYTIKQPGFVRGRKGIDRLIELGVRRVKVDTSKRLEEHADHTEPASSIEEKGSSKDRATFEDNGFTERLVESKQLFDEAKDVQERVLSDILQGQPVDPEPIADFTSQSIETIFDNPDALACVINIRKKDQYLLEHSVSVSILISIFGRYLKLDKELIQDLAIGAFLHDTGKVRIPDWILNKPGRLTDAEFEVMKKHATYSKEIVYKTEGISELSRQIVSNHHEKLNGEGYPLGKTAQELTRYDRMISICDIYDALCAERVYKEGIAQIRAFAILRELAKMNHLDESLVDQFIKCLGVFPVGSLVKLSSKRLAVVDGRNQELPTRPKVKAFFDLSKNSFVPTQNIDLSLSEEEQIERGVRAEDFDLDMGKITEFLKMQG